MADDFPGPSNVNILSFLPEDEDEFEISPNIEVVSTETYPILLEDDDQIKLRNLVAEEFDMAYLLPVLIEAQITFRSLKYLGREEINLLVQNLGVRAEFREKLFSWRKKEFGVDDETSSLHGKLDEQLHNAGRSAEKPELSSFSPENLTPKIKDIALLLKETSRGRSLLEFYEKHSFLTNPCRDELISIIVEDAVCSNIFLKPDDFPSIVQQIVYVFPNEKNSFDYYFIPREEKKNPSGKLYSKYSNSRCKKKKFCAIYKTEPVLDSNETLVDIDESVSRALKNSLSRDSSDWVEVEDKWTKTYSVRQKEIKELSNIDFLKSWPKFADCRAPSLINIDFNLMYPGKERLLFSKWEIFKHKIADYYQLYIHNEKCKHLFSKAKSSENTNGQDYIYTSLLNSVLLPCARFKDNSGKNKKKATIIDAQESFSLRLSSINDYERKVDELINKYYSIGRTIQPLLIVVGIDDDAIEAFYVYFDEILYKFDSFIQALDICFKIFQILHLQYPVACNLPWIFIQKFFFDIHTNYDIKSPNITSLLNFFQQ